MSQRLARANERRLQLAAHPILYPVASMAARLGPVVAVPGLGHVVSDLGLAREVLASPQRFSKTGPGALSSALTSVFGPRALVNMDGPAHTALRAQLQPLVTSASMRALVERQFAPPMTDAVARLTRGARVDVARLANILTGRLACAMVGISLPEGREDQTCLELHEASVEFTRVLTLAGRSLDVARLELARQKFQALTRFARAAFDTGSEETVPGRLRALGLDFEASCGVIGLMLLAGTETTASALPRTAALLLDTGQWDRLRNDRRLLDGTVNEGLRLTAAVPVMTRNVVANTTLGGRALAADTRVIVLLFHILRTRSAVELDPLDFDIARATDRSARGSPWFGHGPHFCLGAALARHQLSCALGILLDAGPLRIVQRCSARRRLLPAYASLTLARQEAR